MINGQLVHLSTNVSRQYPGSATFWTALQEKLLAIMGDIERHSTHYPETISVSGYEGAVNVAWISLNNNDENAPWEPNGFYEAHRELVDIHCVFLGREGVKVVKQLTATEEGMTRNKTIASSPQKILRARTCL